MRARSSIQLVLAGALPMALAGCSKPDDTVAYSVKNNFKSVQECADAKIPVDVCSDAYMQALSDHRKIAPTYDDQASCDADFVQGYCQATSDGKFMPKMGGFELAMSGKVPKAEYEQAQAQASSQGSGWNGNGLLTGLLIGHMLSGGGGNRYYSQPVYDTRDSRGAYSTSTLSRQIEQGKTFSRSTQAMSSGTGSYASTLGRSLGNSGSGVSSTISRGGFGQQATARSGWGGRSSGGGVSFGG
ncbi:DUF1190 domain-containing protein [Pseudomonas sp. RIT-PI-S]|uniref:DUF1190 domain-containing protein n=1 Tax=Pseudomonas sp. RIT-PI-S TaxID=3035295 RepID=UPI0021D8106C|nr:DUF1190 domain-containing protein [Pseudomonas sp. RIT-PI-S]